MKDLEKILQDSGVLIQTFFINLYCHFDPRVKGHSMHPSYQMAFGHVWLDAA